MPAIHQPRRINQAAIRQPFGAGTPRSRPGRWSPRWCVRRQPTDNRAGRIHHGRPNDTLASSLAVSSLSPSVCLATPPPLPSLLPSVTLSNRPIVASNSPGVLVRVHGCRSLASRRPTSRQPRRGGTTPRPDACSRCSTTGAGWRPTSGGTWTAGSIRRATTPPPSMPPSDKSSETNIAR